ncbi:MAG: BamA/TamA family outer membrane protein [Pseudomonadota bacterium]
MHSYWKKYLFGICTLGLLTSCDWFHKDEEDPTKDLFSSEGIHYDVTFTPELTGALETSIKRSSKLLRLAINQPSSKSALLKRAAKDQELFLHILHENGYFEGTVNFHAHDETGYKENTSAEKDAPKSTLLGPEKPRIIIDFKIIPGDRFTIGGITINTDSASDFKQKQTLRLTEDIVGLKAGEPVELEKLEDARRKIKNYFLEKGYPFVDVHTPQGILNTENRSLYVTFPVSIKYHAIIAGTKIEGLTQISPSFVKNRITWKEGDPYNEKEVKRTQKKLIMSNVISNFHVTAEPIPNSSDDATNTQKIIMHAKASEARPRIIGTGARYSTSEGIGGRIFWHHNNVFGNGEHLGASIKSSKREQRGKISYDIPDLGGAENILSFQGILLREKTRAYSGRTLTGGMSYDIPIQDTIHTSVGILNDASHLYAQNTVFNSHLTGIPIIAKIDTSNNFLDPSQGMRLAIQGTPYWGKLGDNRGQFTKATGNLNVYIPLKQNELGEGKLVLAGYAKAGTLFINDFTKTPPNKRFYSGGAASIRAYSYQMVGPLDASSVPLGGRSMAECGAELRARVSESIGLATFFEAAAVTTKRAPEFGTKNSLYGAGFGVRYFSGFGPIRFDVAFPFTRRKDPYGKRIDSPYQFYISVGQAF